MNVPSESPLGLRIEYGGSELKTKEELAQEKKRRFDFAQAVYDDTDASESRSVDMREIGKRLGLESQTTDRIFQYLSKEGLIRSVAMGGAIGITHQGIVEIESAIDKPDTSTEHFPAINYIHVEQMHNSQIQQGAHSSSQAQTVSQDRIPELKDFIQKLRSELPNLKLSASASQEAEAELATLEAQTNSSKPKMNVIKISLGALKELLMHTAGALGAHELIAHIPHFL